MRKSTRKLFKQLEDRRRAITFIPYPDSPNYGFFANLIPERPSAYPKGSLGHFADQINKTPGALIEQFTLAGILGLTPLHKLSDAHKETLLEFLRSAHRHKSEAIYEDTQPVAERIVVVQSIDDQLLRHLAREPQSVYNLEPRKFEELVAHILEDLGCEVNLTKRTRDGGYDILGHFKAGPAPLTFLVECKRYAPSNKVGVEVVRGLYGLTEMHRVNMGMIITTSSFTKDAIEEKLRIGPRLDLKEFNDLKLWLQRYAHA